MSPRLSMLALVPVLLLGVACHSASHKDDQTVAFTALPDAVKAGFAREAPGATITDVVIEDEDGKTIYEAKHVKVGDRMYREIEIAADGKLVKKKEEKK